MPKEVDHSGRRRELADAACRVIARNGLAGTTLADVAEESGWSIGSIRYYFPTKDELVASALWRGGGHGRGPNPPPTAPRGADTEPPGPPPGGRRAPPRKGPRPAGRAPAGPRRFPHPPGPRGTPPPAPPAAPPTVGSPGRSAGHPPIPIQGGLGVHRRRGPGSARLAAGS